MIPNHTNRNVQTSGVTATGEFQISLDHSAHIMKILRSQLYSDKILAILREYSANAWDANREVGKQDVPIKVVLPTTLDPSLYVRDYGPGISHEDMFAIYAQYGVSTKRGSNGQVGMLGIGSKSGFAYTDSFTVTTWQDGTQRIYAALLNNDEKGTLNLLDESPSDEPNGTEVQIPARPTDIPNFVQKAEKLFFHFRPRPDINITLPPEPVPEVVMQHGSISRGHGIWMVVMGCIAYSIDLSQLRGLNAHRGGAGDFLDRLDGYLYFGIGEVEIAASREGLEYSDKTKRVLIDKFIDIVDEFVKHTLDKIEAGDFTFWERRCRAQVLNDLQLPIPSVMTSLTDERIDFGDTKSFVITYGPKQSQVRYVHVGPAVRLLIRDEVRKIDGYGLSIMDYVIRLNSDVIPLPTMEDVRKELAEIVETAKITGIQIADISSVSWHAKAKFSILPQKKTNKKHQVKTFVLKTDKTHYGIPWSDCWDIEDRVPADDDVYVLLRGFKILHDSNTDTYDAGIRFYSQYVKDRDILKPLKIPIPKIYGYKSTEKVPIDVTKILGKSYADWRMAYLKQATQYPSTKKIFDSLEWVKLITRSSRLHHYRDNTSISPKILTKLFTTLGKDHIICVFLRKVLIAKRELKRVNQDKINALNSLLKLLTKEDMDSNDVVEKTEKEVFKENIEKTYPMFELFDGGFNNLIDDDTSTDAWIEYIQLVDRDKKGLRHNESASTHDNGRSNHDSVEGEGPHGEEGSPELRQPEECDQRSLEEREVGEYRRPLDGLGNGEGVVERQVRTHRNVSDLLRAVGP